MSFNMRFRRRALWIAVAALIIIVVAWNTPALDPAMYPFRLFVTYVHEASHGIAAEITGGDVLGFVVYPSGAGLATTRGGARALILPAGYIGAALFGAGLFYLTNTWRRTRVLSAALGVGLVVFSVLYARPDEQGRITALLVGVGFGLALLAIAWKLSLGINLLVLNVLAMLTGMNALLDIHALVDNSGASFGQLRNDAAAFSAEVFPLPPVVWALLWLAVSALVLGFAVYASLIRPLRRSKATGSVAPSRDEETILDVLKRGR